MPADERWRGERLSGEELASLCEIVDERAPDLRPLVDDVLGTRLITDEAIEPFEAILSQMMLDEPYLSPRWLAADHLIGRVDSQSERFWK